KSRWQSCKSSTFRERRTTSGRPPMVSPRTASSRAWPKGSSPSTPMRTGEAGSAKAVSGHSTNCRKLKRKTALIWYSRLGAVRASRDVASGPDTASDSSSNTRRNVGPRGFMRSVAPGHPRVDGAFDFRVGGTGHAVFGVAIVQEVLTDEGDFQFVGGTPGDARVQLRVVR